MSGEFDFFEQCAHINALMESRNTSASRDELIRILHLHRERQIPYNPLLNRLIRAVGLYPYIKEESSTWEDRFAYESFKVDIGNDVPTTLHSEQSRILKQLLSGKSLAISAPTSFGKSFIIDAFIAIKKPANVLIIVPTIALTDETRRRLQKKFSNEYQLVTTSDVPLAEKNIFVFPQERAIHYADLISSLDLLVIDEFYKASPTFDEERAPALMRAILKLSSIAAQRYFLAPNISELGPSIFTKGMEFISLDFNTVFLEQHHLYKQISGDIEKAAALKNIIERKPTKTLIYAGTYSAVDNVSQILLEGLSPEKSELADAFANWLEENYSTDWRLPALIRQRTGVHTGQLHRCLSQIQIKLFEESDGIDNLISTSSIIEGVNTSAENVVVWKNKNGQKKLTHFTYKNIIGRSGRMFKHFIGNVYLLEAPPKEADTNLTLPLVDDVLSDIDMEGMSEDLTSDQISKIIQHREEMTDLFGADLFAKLQKDNLFQSSQIGVIKQIAGSMRNDPEGWAGLGYLNSDSPDAWERHLYKAINFIPGKWGGVRYSVFVSFVKLLSHNWRFPLPHMLKGMSNQGLDVDTFFQLERIVSFKLAALFNDINILHKELINADVDISPFVTKLSHAFLPSCVYQLEEYGLPRTLSRKLQQHGIIDFSSNEITLHSAIESLKEKQNEVRSLFEQGDFDLYIFDYFIDGVSPKPVAHTTPSIFS